MAITLEKLCEGCNVKYQMELVAGKGGINNTVRWVHMVEDRSGKVLGEILEDMKAKHKCVGDVRYIGLFSAVELVKSKETREPVVPYGKDPDNVMGKLIGKLKAKGFMTYSHENMIMISPPLIITEEQVREEMIKLDEVLSDFDSEM